MDYKRVAPFRGLFCWRSQLTWATIVGLTCFLYLCFNAQLSLTGTMSFRGPDLFGRVRSLLMISICKYYIRIEGPKFHNRCRTFTLISKISVNQKDSQMSLQVIHIARAKARSRAGSGWRRATGSAGAPCCVISYRAMLCAPRGGGVLHV